MPSTILGNPASSGAQQIVSGNPWSGQLNPHTGIQLLWCSSGGNAYVGLSGGMTLTSGGMFLSGGGLLDGMLLLPFKTYFIPKGACGISGTISVYAWCDAAASGVGRLYYELF